MKRILLTCLTTLSAVALAMGYHTSQAPDGEATAQTSQSQAATASTNTETTTDSASNDTTSTNSAQQSSSNGLADGSFSGSSVSTRYGNVQVSIQVKDGKVSAVDVPQYPDSSSRDRRINERAVPELVKETVGGTSAKIDMVSGATYTSTGYIKSLQSALDEARA